MEDTNYHALLINILIAIHIHKLFQTICSFALLAVTFSMDKFHWIECTYSILSKMQKIE